jgi:hypothetical protein
LKALAQSPPMSSAHEARTEYDEFLVRAHNERVIKRAIKNSIIALAEAHRLGPDEFCDPQSASTYVLGTAVIGASYILAGQVAGLPTNTSVRQLADDAVYELCDEVEDDESADYEEDDEEEFGGIAILRHYLGRPGGEGTPPMIYRVGFTGKWAFEGANEVKLLGALIGARAIHYSARAADSRNPVDAIKVVLPPAGTTPRRVTNYICPTQLPTAAITTTTNANDTLMCSGGSLPLDQQFSLNVQSSPLPSAGMGGQLIVHQDGAYLPALPFGGP